MRLSKTSFAAGAIFALVLGSGGAYAATGGKFILGRANSARTTSSLSAGKGPALSLKASGPVLKVSNGSKITNLNVDKLDGLSSSAFARTSGRTGAIDASGTPLDLDDNGLTDTIVANAQCPAGTQRTGGGSADFTSSGYLFLDAPDTDDSWTVAVAVDENTSEDPSNVTASVVCYNPSGAIAGTYLSTTSTTHFGSLSPTTRRQIIAKAQHPAR